MKKNRTILVTAVEIIGLLLINYLIPAETTWPIIGKTAIALVWIGLAEMYRKKNKEKNKAKEDK